MILKLILTFIGAVLSGYLGRLGGKDNSSTLYRDIGCSLVCCAVLALWGGFSWTLVFVFGAMWGALSTYFKKKGEPVRWYNWIFVGIAFCVACLPYVLAIGLWAGFGIRMLILPLAVMGWCVVIGKDWLEEFGRYFILVITIPLLFLFKKRKEK